MSVRSPAILHVACGERPTISTAPALRIYKSQIDRLRVSSRPIKRRTFIQPGPDDRVRYDDAELLAVRFMCTTCEAKRSINLTTR